jgi:small subunit ribosomal protein S8e
MSQWHGDLGKRKPTGGKVRRYRGKRAFEMGSPPTETTLGKPAVKLERIRGGGTKIRLKSFNYANVTDPATKKTSKAEITRVVKNPANIDYNRRGVITKGTIIETSLGQAKVTSKPGQNGVVNALLLSKSGAE